MHQDSSKSHTGCAIVHGESGPVFAKSAKQKIVTKSSTKAELVDLSASQAIYFRNLIIAKGYDIGTAVVYQDDMSCMALIKQGGLGSDRSRHINICHFCLSEKVALKEVVNILIKHVQGAQFERERLALTNSAA